MLQVRNQISSSDLSTTDSRIINDLLDNKLITTEEITILLEEYHKRGSDIGTSLIDFGFISEIDFNEFIQQQYGCAVVNLKTAPIDSDAISLISKEVAARYTFLPFAKNKNTICVATKDILDNNVQNTMLSYIRTNENIVLHYARKMDITDAIEVVYTEDIKIQDKITELGLTELGNETGNQTVQFVNFMLKDALKRDASDIHIEPEESFIRIRYRIDGVLIKISVFHKKYWPNILNRIKIISGMNITEARHPQDGRLEATILGREVDFRLASQPTIHGENVIIRILDKKKSLTTLENLGISKGNNAKLKQALDRPDGIIIVTGPTGSGKTTTLYSALAYLNNIEVNIMTLEDPVEYSIPLIRQTAIQDDIGLTFNAGIRSLMRQDPDIMLIGEVRDLATAQAAIRASLTGHKVLTTLHTIDAISAIQRLTDIGIDRYMLSGNIVAIVAQRLVRKLCNHCKKPRVATDEDFAQLKLKKPDKAITIYDHAGCSKCSNTGYRGRTAVSEVLLIDSAIDDMITGNQTRNAILSVAKKNGFKTLADDAKMRIMQGVTDLHEVQRIVSVR